MNRRNTILVTPADTHAGSPVGLIPPGQWAFVNGGYHNPDETQRILYQLWLDSWRKVAKARQGKRLVVVHVGDAVEGKHHDSSQIITPRIDEHERIHVACMTAALRVAGFDADAGDMLYYVAGTQAHTGPGSQSEERIARDLEAVPFKAPTNEDQTDGRYLWPRLRLEVNGKLFDIAHHGANLGSRPWTRTNSLRYRLQAVYFAAIEKGLRVPDVWLRAHRHAKAHDTFISNTNHTIDGYITPAFQSKTEYGYKVASDEIASMGLLWFDITKDGRIQDFWNIIEVDVDEVVKL